jgi:hypothetical protein
MTVKNDIIYGPVERETVPLALFPKWADAEWPM